MLTHVKFSCQTGEMVGIFGRNGSGKSTLLKILFGTLPADSIEVLFDATKIEPIQIIPNQYIAYLPQEGFLPKDMKVRDIIPLYFRDGEKQNQLFYAPKVASFANKRVSTLSHGELRYVEILLIAHLEHPFLLLDEPFSMIEPLYKDSIKELLSSLKAKKGIILTDHYYRDVLQITDKNLLMINGTLHEIKGKEDLAEHGYTSS